MIARAALVKPWVFTEISERKVWDISASERLDLLKRFVRFGLEHWGSDSRGVATTRRFLLELLSFQHRYVPPPFFEFLPQLLQWRPSPFVARSNLENMLASPSVKDWIDISSLLLGPPPEDFSFVPKHASNSYAPLSSSTSSLSTVRASADPSGLQPPSGGLLFDVTSFFHSQILGNVVVLALKLDYIKGRCDIGLFFRTHLPFPLYYYCSYLLLVSSAAVNSRATASSFTVDKRAYVRYGS
ncbi:dihydrouridine synthase (dus) protein [Toxoplasma gondii p89]|uniref:Dihydrouridine synthase (Dus) protein n=1 Tax=Toxoplasma gondii p89 TaxID=943119 RepID=A0A086KCH8_TOXGO|nr:dihydrouridine synthase (dus) protein [Toxoplasma gondii p89]